MPQVPRSVPLIPVPPEQLARIPGLPKVVEHKTKFPKRAAARADAKAALRRWQDAAPPPPDVRNPDVQIRAVRPTSANLAKLRAVAESDVAPAELLTQKMDIDTFFGTLYSALTTYEFIKMQAEYKRRIGTGRGVAATEQQWRQVVEAAQTAFAAAGDDKVREADLTRFARELSSSKANLDTIIRIANSARGEVASTLTARTSVVASVVPVAEKFVDRSEIIIAILNLCDEPLKQGSFTKHFSRSISLSVKIKYWCPTWTNPLRTCTKTITLAGVSFSIGVNVGYKINCCGATVWGQAHSQVCATIVGISVCASCTATITGVAGVSRTPVSGGCLYGLGIMATLQCKFAGQTILNISYPFGWTVSGPCPPAGVCP